MPLISIAGTDYAVAEDSLLPKGKVLATRRKRSTNGTDPGRIRTAVWNVSGPAGTGSREKGDRPLGVDYVQNLETRFDDLLTSSGKRNSLSLSTSLNASNTAYFGGPKFGALGTKFGGAVAGTTIAYVAEQNSYMIFFGGRVATQVRISDWAVVDTHIFDATVKGVASWFGKVRVGLGGTKALQTLTGISESGMTWADQQVSSTDVLAKALEVGTDRLWLVRASSTGANDNEVRYTLDDFSSISNSFVVGNPKAGATGLGSFGAAGVTSVGSEVGIYAATNEGKPIALSKALAGTRSSENGRQFADPGFGFQYAISAKGLRALIPGQFDQPIGIGSPYMRGFEGHDGRPVAILPVGDELMIAYETSAGDAYLYRCVPGQQGNALNLDHFPLAYISSTEVRTFFSTATPTNPVIGWGAGTNATYIAQGRTGADIYDANYDFSTGGGVWYGTTLTRNQHLKKTLRLVRFATENMSSGDSWQVAMKFDTAAYLNIGSAVTSSGYQTVRPVSGGAPISNITGHALKLRLTQVAAGADSETSPPQIRGPVEAEYDERPAEITELDIPIHLGAVSKSTAKDLATLELLSGSSTDGPVAIKLWDDRTTVRYGMVAGVETQDVKGDDVKVAVVRVQLWDVA